MLFCRVMLNLLLICSFSAAYSAVPVQDRSAPQARPAPGGAQPGRPQPGGGRPNQGNGSQPGRPNPGAGQQRPVRPPTRPSPPTRPQPVRPPVRPVPGGGNNRPGPVRPGRPGMGRPPQWGRPPVRRPAYNFRPNDRVYLHRYYRRSLLGINPGMRPRFVVGGFFPYGSIQYLTPLPPDVYGYLPPPPPGYQMGYFDGYVVVYDPLTYFMANVIDLLQ